MNNLIKFSEEKDKGNISFLMSLEDELTIILYNKFKEDNNIILNLIKKFSKSPLELVKDV